MGEIKYNGKSYSGLIQANGCFVDTTNLLLATTSFRTSYSYTATEDCFVCLYVVPKENDDVHVDIDGEKVAAWWRGSAIADETARYLRKGQTISVVNAHASYDSFIWVYGLMQGSPITFLSEYASACYDTNEREVGCFVDGKPVYQRTFYHRNTQSSFSDFVTIDSIADVETIVSLTGIAHRQVDTFDGWLDISSRPETQTNYAVCMRYANGNLQYRIDTYGTQINDIYITIQYTKTTDTAGSGHLTPTGTPTVHYSTNEQVVGTWVNGKPVYEKTQYGGITFNGQTWQDTNITDIDDVISVVGVVLRDNEPIALGDFNNSLTTSWIVRNHILKVCVQSNTSSDPIAFKSITARYTKTTD